MEAYTNIMQYASSAFLFRPGSPAYVKLLMGVRRAIISPWQLLYA